MIGKLIEEENIEFLNSSESKRAYHGITRDIILNEIPEDENLL